MKDNSKRLLIFTAVVLGLLFVVVVGMALIALRFYVNGQFSDAEIIAAIANIAIQCIIGIGTVGALVGAIYQIYQNTQDRRDDIKIYQPSRVSVWYEGTRKKPLSEEFATQPVVLQNESETPVYDVVVTCVQSMGPDLADKGEQKPGDYASRFCAKVLPPGSWCTKLYVHDKEISTPNDIPEIAFTDARGVSWVRRSDGKLEEIGVSPIAFYKLTPATKVEQLKRFDLSLALPSE